METWNGANLTGVLGAMSAGNPSQKETYNSIKETFDIMHAPLKLNPWRHDGIWELGFLVPDIEDPLPASSVGMGTLQTLLMITNLSSSEGRVIILEEPELHLHPSAQRAFQQVLVQAGKRNQLLVVTHSPDILSDVSDFQVLRLSSDVRPSLLETKPVSDIGRIAPAWVRDYLKDSLFSRVVILTEGPYDFLTLQNLLNILLPNWRSIGGSVVPVDGKYNVSGPYQYLRALGLEVIVILDNDALTYMDKTLKIHGESITTSSAVRQAYDCSVFSNDRINEIREFAENTRANVDNMRQALACESWFVLSSTFDDLILTAAGESPRRSRKRRAEVISRGMEAELIPKEIHQIVARFKSKLGVE